MKLNIIIFILILTLGFSSNFYAHSAQKKTNSTASLLKSGSWFKIKVEKTGVYKLSYDDLISLGLSQPENVRVYGLGGGQLPYMNNVDKLSSIVELPIEMVNPSGSFNSGDYILFFTQGPTTWSYNNSIDLFTHHKHVYSNYIYLLVSDSFGPGKRIANYQAPSSAITQQSNQTNSYRHVDVDNYNLIKSGRVWYENKLKSGVSEEYSFSFDNLINNLPVKGQARVAGRNKNNAPAAYINLRHNNTPIYNQLISPYYNIYTYANPNNIQFQFNEVNSSFELSFNVSGGDADTEGYVDYICINATEEISLSTTNQLLFRDLQTVGLNNITQFSINNYQTEASVWEVTNPIEPYKITPDNSGKFTCRTDSLLEFVAAGPNSYLTPIINGDDLGQINNQDLQGIQVPDLLIVSHPNFLQQANNLAQIHSNFDSLKVFVCTPEEIYNEYSAGTPDASAIRNFVRELYHKESNPDNKLKYLLLFGDGSYDNKLEKPENSNYIPTYQNYNGESTTSSFVTDDFYGLLDFDEGGSIGRVDIGIGRLPVQTVEEAQLMVDKIWHYMFESSADSWKNTICFIGDDEDGQIHMQQADEITTYISENHPAYSVNKIYLDAYKQESTPSGQRYPEVTQAINEQVAQGALIIDYVGHGNTRLITKEEVLKTSDVRAWRNLDKLSVFVTASCEVGRFDDYELTSLGEWILLNPNGGGIAAITTTRVVYSGGNHTLNTNLFSELFNPNLRLGDLIRLAKNSTGTTTSINRRNFTLLGDPALRLHIPKNEVVASSINNKAIPSIPAGEQMPEIKITHEVVDTLQALSLVDIKGYIANENGDLIDANGIVYATIFDKAIQVSTFGNDNTIPLNYLTQNSILFKGKASIKNGFFNLTFRMPKDINYTYGQGKMSLFANIDSLEAIGYTNSFVIGGSTSNFPFDNQGPEMQLYLNDSTFISGGTTDENPTLLIKLNDASGINTTGIGIGHNITAIMDNNYDNLIVLNPFYEGEIDTYLAGTIQYPLSNLTPGYHSIKVTAWDTQNNVSESEINFNVAKGSEMVIEGLVCKPNPFNQNTTFSFYHNQPNSAFDITIDIYNIMGQKVQELKQNNTSGGYVSTPIVWDGSDFNGNALKNGVYPYRVNITDINGQKISKSSKLVIFR